MRSIDTNPQQAIEENAPRVRKSLRRQFSWTLPANAIFGACSLLLLVVLNKFGSTAIAGDFSLAMAITAPVFMFARLKFSTVLASDMRKKVHLADYIKLRAAMVVAAVAVVGLVCLVRGTSGIFWLLLMTTLVKCAESVSDLCVGIQQRIERMDRLAITLAANGLLISLFFAASYYFTRNLTVSVGAIFLARCVVILCYELPMARVASRETIFHQLRESATNSNTDDGKSERKIVRARLLALLLSAAPLGVTAALVSLTLNIPRYVISAAHGRETLGLFATVAVVLQAGALIFKAIEQPAVPRLAAYVEQRDSYRYWSVMFRICCLFFAIAVACSFVSLVFGPYLLELAFNPDFRRLGAVLALMSLAASISQMAGMIESSLIAARMTAVQVPMHCITVATCFVLCLVLIPTMELYGAVLAVGVCRFPFMLLGVWFLRKKFAEDTPTTTDSTIRKIGSMKHTAAKSDASKFTTRKAA